MHSIKAWQDADGVRIFACHLVGRGLLPTDLQAQHSPGSAAVAEVHAGGQCVSAGDGLKLVGKLAGVQSWVQAAAAVC